MAKTDTRSAGGVVIPEPEEPSALALVPVEERGIRGLELADRMFTPEQRGQVAALLAVPENSPALMPFLALCIAEGFSPWANHVWLIPKTIKIKATDGGEDTTEKKYLPAVGRDGLLHKYRQSKGLRAPGCARGLTYAVVCERDTFEVEFSGDEMSDPKIVHRFTSKPTTFEADASPARYRGRVIGAWCKLLLHDEPPQFYFANLLEHGRRSQRWDYNPEARRRQPLWFAGPPAGGAPARTYTFDVRETGRPVEEWEGAWDYTSTMILKAAQSYVLRIGLGVTGYVPVDELRSVEEWQQDAGPAQSPGGASMLDDFDFDSLDVSGELRERLRVAVARANEQEAFSWGPAKCEMVFRGRPEGELFERVERIEAECDLRDRQREQRAAEPVVDAEAVEDRQTPEAAQERISVLQARLAGLRANANAATEAQLDELGQEMDQVIAELRSLGVEPPAAA